MCGYGSTAQSADCANGLKYGLNITSIAEGVRSAQMVDAATCKIEMSRIELYDKSVNKWFEAKKVGETYKLTVKGANDQEKRKEACEASHCVPDSCPK